MKLILVDDHRILIEGIRALLDNTHEVLTTCTDPRQALQFIRQHDVDALITDYEMPGMNGIELFTAAKNHKPLLKGILLSMHDERVVVKQALAAGMHGFLLKNVSPSEFTLALEKIRQGHTYISAELTQKALQKETTDDMLSERERQVLQLILKEKTNKQIAEILFLSERTVETYRKNLFRKANTNNIVGLLKYAFTHKLIE
ncbi:MAG: response regulator [Cyclobacteriaceae bacterium]